MAFALAHNSLGIYVTLAQNPPFSGVDGRSEDLISRPSVYVWGP